MSTWRAFSEGRTERILGGEFRCRLNCDEVNEWNEHVVSTPEFKRLQAAEIAVAAAYMALVDYDQCASSIREQEDATRAMFAVAKAWFAGLTERRKLTEKEE